MTIRASVSVKTTDGVLDAFFADDWHVGPNWAEFYYKGLAVRAFRVVMVQSISATWEGV